MSPTPVRAGAPRRRGRLLDWKAILGILISAVLLYITFSRMDLRDVWQQLRGVNVPVFIAATAIITFVFWIRAWRWRYILEPVADVPFRERFAAVNIGFMGNNLLPARLGEFLRAYSLARLTPVPVVGALASLVVERTFDGIFVIGLLFLAMLSPQFPPFMGVQEIAVPGTDQSFTIAGLARSLAVVVAMLIAFLFALVLWPRRAVAVAERSVSWLPEPVQRPLVSSLEAFLAGAGVLRRPRLMLRVAAWSAVLWLWNALGFWVAFHAFGITLPYTAAVFFASAIALAASLPAAPGFIGPWHLMATFLLADMWGVSLSTAGAFAVGFHLAGFVPVTLMGLYYAWRMGLSVGEATASEEVVEDIVEMQIPDREIERQAGEERGRAGEERGQADEERGQADEERGRADEERGDGGG